MEIFKYLKPSDFKEVGIVANTCNKEKLNISINEALEFDIKHVFCFPFVNDMLENWDLADLDDEAAALKPIADQMKRVAIIGGNYKTSSGRMESFPGIRKIWLYYSYSKYVIVNSADDTPNGLVSKTNNFSMPLEIGRLKALETKYKNMAKDSIDHTLTFLHYASRFIPTFEPSRHFLSCGCAGFCTCNGKPRKITGFKIKNVEK